MKRFFKRLADWTLGFSMGAGVGAVLIALFAPVSSEEVRGRLRRGYQEAVAEARRAAQQERARLEAELAELTGQTPPEES